MIMEQVQDNKKEFKPSTTKSLDSQSCGEAVSTVRTCIAMFLFESFSFFIWLALSFHFVLRRRDSFYVGNSILIGSFQSRITFFLTYRNVYFSWSVIKGTDPMAQPLCGGSLITALGSFMLRATKTTVYSQVVRLMTTVHRTPAENLRSVFSSWYISVHRLHKCQSKDILHICIYQLNGFFNRESLFVELEA